MNTNDILNILKLLDNQGLLSNILKWQLREIGECLY